MEHLRALFVLDGDAYDVVYAPAAAAEINRRVTVLAPPQTKARSRPPRTCWPTLT